MLDVEVKQSYFPTQLWYDNNCMQEVGIYFFFSCSVGGNLFANISNLFTCQVICLSELKLRMSEEQNCISRVPQRNDCCESTGSPKEAGTQEATSVEPAPSVEETMDSVLRRLKEKRQHFNLPETIKVFNNYHRFFQNFII